MKKCNFSIHFRSESVKWASGKEAKGDAFHGKNLFQNILILTLFKHLTNVRHYDPPIMLVID